MGDRRFRKGNSWFGQLFWRHLKMKEKSHPVLVPYSEVNAPWHVFNLNTMWKRIVTKDNWVLILSEPLASWVTFSKFFSSLFSFWLFFPLFSLWLYLCYWSIIDIQCYISFRCTMQWLDIYVQDDHYGKSTYHLSPLKLLQYYWLYSLFCILHPHDLFIL